MSSLSLLTISHASQILEAEHVEGSLSNNVVVRWNVFFRANKRGNRRELNPAAALATGPPSCRDLHVRLLSPLRRPLTRSQGCRSARGEAAGERLGLHQTRKSHRRSPSGTLCLLDSHAKDIYLIKEGTGGAGSGGSSLAHRFPPAGQIAI